MPEQLTIRIGAEATQATQALRQVSASLRQVGESAKTASAQASSGLQRMTVDLKKVQSTLREVSSQLRTLAIAWGGLVTGLVAGAMKAGMTMEQLQMRFESLTESAEAARKMMDQVRQLSMRSVFDFQSLANAVAQVGNAIKGAGGNFQQAIPLVMQLQAALTAVGRTSQEDLQRGILAITQMIGKGRVQMEELMQLAELGVANLSALRQELKLSADAFDNLSKAGVTVNDVINALVRTWDKAGWLKRAGEVQTIGAAFSNLRQTVTELFGKMGMEIFKVIQGPLANLVSALMRLSQDPNLPIFAQRVGEAVARVINGLTALVDKIRELINWFAQLPPAAQRALSHLFVEGPLIVGAIAGITALGQRVLWLANLFKITLPASVATAATAIGTRLNLIVAMVSAAAVVLGHELSRLSGMLQYAQQQRAQEQQIRQFLRQQTQPGLAVGRAIRGGKLTPEAQQRLQQLQELIGGQESFLPPLEKPSPPPELPKFPKFDLGRFEAAAESASERAKRAKEAAEKARKTALDALQDQLERINALIRLEQFRIDQLIKQGKFKEAEERIENNLRKLLNERSLIELRIETTRKQQVTEAERAAKWIERVTELEQIRAKLLEAQERAMEKQRQEQLKQMEYEWELLRMEEEFQRRMERELRLPEYIPSEYERIFGVPQMRDFEREQEAVTRETEAWLDAIRYGNQLIEQIRSELEGLPTVTEETANTIQQWVEPTQEVFNLARWQVRIKELEIQELQTGVKTLQERLRLEMEIVANELARLKWALENAKTDEERLKILEQIAQLTRRASEIQEELTEATKTKWERLTDEMKRNIDEITDRFADAIAEWLAGFRSFGSVLRDFFRNLQYEIYRTVIRGLFDPLLQALRAWAQKIGEVIFGSIAKQPVLTFAPIGGEAAGILGGGAAGILGGGVAGILAGLAVRALGGGKTTSALAGAATGFAVGGPVGAVIGGLVGWLFGKKKKTPSAPTVIPLGMGVATPSLNINTSVTLQVDGRELGRVLVRQAY